MGAAAALALFVQASHDSRPPGAEPGAHGPSARAALPSGPGGGADADRAGRGRPEDGGMSPTAVPDLTPLPSGTSSPSPRPTAGATSPAEAGRRTEPATSTPHGDDARPSRSVGAATPPASAGAGETARPSPSPTAGGPVGDLLHDLVGPGGGAQPSDTATATAAGGGSGSGEAP
ncbi:hypothetical protein GCM10023237_64220 [Streptomyces coeruleoprunus]